MSLDGPARRSNLDASAEPAVKSPSSDGETALMRAAARGTWPRPGGTSTSAGERRQWQDSPVYAAQRGCKEAVEAFLEYEKGMSDSQNHNALLGSQEWAHRSRQDRHSSRGPDRRGWYHRAHAGRSQRGR